MAESRPVQSSEIIQPELFKNTTLSAAELEAAISGLDKVFDGLVSTLEKVSKETQQVFDANKQLKNAKAVKETAVALEKQERHITQILRSDVQREKLKAAQIATQKRETAERERATKAAERQTKLTEKEQSAYNQMSATLLKLKKEYKDLVLVQGENSKEAQNLLRQITPLDERLKAIDKTVGEGSRTVGLYEKEVGKALEKLKLQRKEVINNITTINNLSNTVNKNTAEYKFYQTQLTQNNIKLQQLNQQLGITQNQTNFLNNATSRLTSTFMKFAGAFGIVFGLQSLFSIMGGGVRIIKEFDTGLIGVAKTTGLAGAELEQLEQDLKNLAIQLENVSVSKLLEYAQVAGQLGVKGSQNILAFSEALAKLETASNIAGEQGAADIARLLSLTDGGVQNVKEFGDEIVNLGNNFAATEQEILSNATQIAQNTGVYNLGRKSVLAYATATKAVGIEAEITGSTIGRTLGLLENAIRTGDNLAEVTRLTGLNQKELNEQFRINSGAVLNKFVEGLNKVFVSGGSVNGVLESIGINAVRDQRVIGSLASNGFNVLNDALVQVGNSAGSLDKEFNTASQSLANAFNTFTNSYQNFILSLDSGDGVISTFLKQLAQIGTAFFNLLIGLNNSKVEVDNTNQSLASVTTTLSNLLKALGVVIVAYGSYRAAIVASNAALAIQRIATINLGSAKRAYVTIVGLATRVQLAFNTATKGNIFGILIGLIVSAASAMFLFKKRTEEATDAQNEFNEAQKETQKLLDNLKEIERTFGQLDNLNERQTIDFITRINEQIAAEEDKFLQFKKLNEEFFSTQNENPFFEEELRNRLADFLGFQREVVITSEGAQTVQNDNEKLLTRIIEGENLKRLNFINQAAQKRLKTFKKTNEEEKRELENYFKQFRDAQIRNESNENIRALKSRRAKFNDDIEALKKDGLFRAELVRELEIELLNDLRELNKKARQQLKEDQLQADNDLFDAEILMLERKLLEFEDVNSEGYKRINDEIKDLTRDRIEDELLALDRKAELTEAEFKRQQELLLQLANLDKKVTEDTTDAAKKSLDEIKNYYDQVSGIIQTNLEQVSDLRTKMFEAETRERDRQLSRQEARAVAGFENTLAFEEQKAAEAEQANKDRLKREAQVKQAAAFADAFSAAYVAALSSKDANGKPLTASQAAQRGFLAAGVGKATASTLVQFLNEGTDFVQQKGAKSPLSKGKDTVDAVLQVGEAVIPTESNLSNRVAVRSLVDGSFKTKFAPKSEVNTGVNMVASMMLQTNMRLLKEVEKLNSKPVQQVAVDTFGNLIETTYKAGVTTKITYKNRFARK